MLSGRSVGGKIDDLDFFIGDEALSPAAANHFVKYPIRHGLVEDWDLMERFWYTFYTKAIKHTFICMPDWNFLVHQDIFIVPARSILYMKQILFSSKLLLVIIEIYMKWS